MSARATRRSTGLHRTVRLAVGLASMLPAIGSTGGEQACTTLPGVNVAGGEFNAGAVPGTYTKDYIYPGPAEISFARERQFRLVRVPLLWERLQRSPKAELDETELSRLDQTLALAAAAGLTTILDIHNYGRYQGAVLEATGPPLLADLWRKLGQRYANRKDVVFGLMNEPHDIPVDDWAVLAKTALDAIRSAGARNVVLVPGTNWDGAHSWQSASGGRSNADALLPLAKDLGVVFEVHQYFDGNASGTSPTCDPSKRVPAVLAQVGRWARLNKVRVFLGEFGVSRRPECIEVLDQALAVVERDRDVWYGWTYWSAGAWWGDYMFNVQTKDEAPQSAVLQRRASALNRATCGPSGG